MSESLTQLTEEVAGLRDLFQRRLLEDKAKNRLYEELYEQLREARGGLAEQVLTPLLRELLLILDRIVASGSEDPELLSVGDELAEVLDRRDVRRIPAGGAFDPSVHEVIRTVETEPERAGTVVEQLRSGYWLGTALLRPARVVVAVPTADETA